MMEYKLTETFHEFIERFLIICCSFKIF